MKEPPVEIEEVKSEELEEILEQVRRSLGEAAFSKLSRVVKAYAYLTGLLEKKSTTLERLRRVIFGSKSEKTEAVFKDHVDRRTGSGEPQTKHPGHGRNGIEAYKTAEKIKVPHPSLQPKDVCPDCEQGKVYPYTPGSLVRITGQAPLKAIELTGVD